MTPDPAIVEAWLRRVPALSTATVRSLQPVTGGASNLTYRVALDGVELAAVALRLQRREGIFQPYSVVREADVLRRLAGTAVPVPAVVGIEWDSEVLGARFLVLEWIDAPHMGDAGADADRGAYARMVATIHRLDWRALGLDVLGVPVGPGNAALAEIAPIARRIRAFGLGDDPLLKRALAVLPAVRPRNEVLALCQGDINTFNYLFRGGHVVGVVDWEQAHIGDSRSDVAQLLALAHLRGVPLGPPREMPFARAYEAASEAPLEGLEFYRALWFLNLTVIHHAWTLFNDTLPWYTLDRVRALLEESLGELQ